MTRRTDAHVQGERELMQREWRPTYYQYLDLLRLQDFYAVETTDAGGNILFESVDPGTYRLAVRLDQPASLVGSGGLVILDDGQERDIGDVALRSASTARSGIDRRSRHRSRLETKMRFPCTSLNELMTGLPYSRVIDS